MSQTVLIHPPACDPTAPYLAVPMLTAFLRTHGHTVTPVDANVEGFAWMFTSERMGHFRDRLENRLGRLERHQVLSHPEQLLYTALWSARAEAALMPTVVDQAVAVLRDPVRFHQPETYAGAVATLDACLRVVSAANAPLTLSFTAYKTPFSMLNAREIAGDAQPERNPFHDYFAGALLDRVRAEQPLVVGISVAFPGQVQLAYSLAYVLKQALPHVHVTAGGPALTQLFQHVTAERQSQAVHPFDSIILYEGEHALLDLVHTLESGGTPPRIITGTRVDDLSTLPAPDFDGLPLGQYFSPELVLPYDPSRGCYWGKCAFCHYGLAPTGTASYRERPVEQVVEHLRVLREKHGTNVFYFSQDAVNPRTMGKLAEALAQEGSTIRWGSDMRPERSLTPELCQQLKAGGALSVALGVESGAPRVLSLINKGVPVDVVRTAIVNLSNAGIAVEAMCFTGFPTETHEEAMATLRLVEELGEHLSLFICGEFDLTAGSRVAHHPSDYGVVEMWQVRGDELGMGLFYRKAQDPMTDQQRDQLNDALAAIAVEWWLLHYPWAGALSTAHTLLFYRHHGPDCFRRFHRIRRHRVPGTQPQVMHARFDLDTVMACSTEHEARIWEQMVQVDRAVSRDAYRALAEQGRGVRTRPGTWQVEVGQPPVPSVVRRRSSARRR